MPEICDGCPEFNRSYGICNKTGEEKSVWSGCDPPLKP